MIRRSRISERHWRGDESSGRALAERVTVAGDASGEGLRGVLAGLRAAFAILLRASAPDCSRRSNSSASKPATFGPMPGLPGEGRT